MSSINRLYTQKAARLSEFNYLVQHSVTITFYPLNYQEGKGYRIIPHFEIASDHLSYNIHISHYSMRMCAIMYVND